MKTEFNDNNLNNSKGYNFISRPANNDSFISKDQNNLKSNFRLSESNIEVNEDFNNKDLRCINCYLIPFISLNSTTHSVNLNCNFGHSQNLTLEEYLQKGYENNFINKFCTKCKIQVLKNDKNFLYCKECSEILCEGCIEKHDNIYADSHHMINIDKFDTTCILHNETYDCFCLDCKKNICQFCSTGFHKEHKLIDLDDIHFKRKEIKKIKENFTKEKEIYDNISNIFIELINKLKDEMDKTLKKIKNEIKFKESIINTYETKVDNYNAIINMKNLVFNIKPFVIDNNITIFENIINLMNFLNMNTEKINKNENSSKKKIKIKKKKENKPNEIIDNNTDNSRNAIKPFRKSNTVYRKSFISKKINYTSNVNKNNNKDNNNKIQIQNNLSVINKNFINSNTNSNNNLQSYFSENPIKNINANSDNNNIHINNNMNKEDQNKMKMITNKTTNNSTNNLNYVIPRPQKSKISLKSNRNIQFRSNEELDKKNKNELNKFTKNNSQSQRTRNTQKDDPFSIIKQFNKQLSDNKEKEKLKNILNNYKHKENKNNDKNDFLLGDMKNVNIKVKSRKLKDEDDEGNLNEEEEEAEYEENDEEEENEEEEEEYEEYEDDEDFSNYKEKNKKYKEEERLPKQNKLKVKSDKKMINLEMSNGKKDRDDDEIIKEKINVDNEENDNSFRHKKIYPKSNFPTQNVNISELFSNKKKVENYKTNSNIKEKEKGISNKKLKNDSNKKKNKLIRDLNVNEFRPKSSNLKIKESNNTVCCILEVKDNIFAIGFLLGEIDVYNVNYLNCLFTILEHKSRISNMFLLKDKTMLTSSYDYTMKKIKVNNTSYIVEFTFNSSKNFIYKGIELVNNDIISISFKGNINIFKRQKSNYYVSYKEHEIANEEIYNVIELVPNKEIAFSTDECLRFFSIDTYQNIGNVHLLEFAKGNNMIHINKSILAILLKHDIGLVNILHRQCIFKCSLGNLGKPECICYLKDNTLLVAMSNNKYEKIQFLFKQYSIKMNKLKLTSEKMEEITKKKKDDHCRITSLIELKNRVIVYGTAGFEEYKLVGNISIID